MRIRFEMSVSSDLIEGISEVSLSVSDNGVGFGEKEREAYVTSHTSYKDDFFGVGLEFARGTGRFQYFKAFENVEIKSRPRFDGSYVASTSFSSRSGFLKKDSFNLRPHSNEKFGTVIRLTGASSDIIRGIEGDFEGTENSQQKAAKIKAQLLRIFHLRLLLVAKKRGNFSIEIEVDDGKSLGFCRISEVDVPEPLQVVPISIRSGENNFNFNLSHFTFDDDLQLTNKNEAWLVARNSPVEDVSRSVLGSDKAEKISIQNAFHLFLLEGELLDLYVTDERDGFNLPASESELNLSGREILSTEKIKERLHWKIAELVNIPKWTKEDTIEEAYKVFGVTSDALARFNIKVQTGESGRKLAQRTLKKAQEEIVEDTRSLIELSEAIKGIDASSSDYEQKLDKIVSLYVDSFEPLALSGLAQLTTRRAAVVDILKDYTQRKSLADIKEEVFHSVLFPMGSSSHDQVRHDLWLLGEDFYIFDHVASDKALSTYEDRKGNKLFDPRIDLKIKDLANRYTRDEKALRPDIAVFTEDETAIIVELKKPSRVLNDAVDEIVDYAGVLAEYSNSRLKRFYGVGIGGHINKRNAPGTEFADGSGYFGNNAVRNEAGVNIGSIYWEIYSYDIVAERASKRVKAYRDQLGI